jgi:hypothetical protein
MVRKPILDCIAVGRICRQTIVPLNKRVYENIIAGPALYAVAGIRSLMENVGLISAFPKQDSKELTDLLDKYSIDESGIIQATDSQSLSQFFGYTSAYSQPSSAPIPFFSAMQMPLPVSMHSGDLITAGDTISSGYYPSELSQVYLNASAAHLCADELDHQLKASALLDKTAISVLTLLSNPNYMIPSHWEMVMNMMNGLTAFITTPAELISLFKNRTNDLVEMGMILHSNGCENLIQVKQAEGFELVSFQKKRKSLIPIYPSEIIDPTGMTEVFCGALLAELRLSHDPVRAVIRGSVVASIKGEGCGPFYPLDTIPGLMKARIERIKDWVKTN